MSEGANVQFSEREALLFHSSGRPGKIEIIASKPMAKIARSLTQRRSSRSRLTVTFPVRFPAWVCNHSISNSGSWKPGAVWAD